MIGCLVPAACRRDTRVLPDHQAIINQSAAISEVFTRPTWLFVYPDDSLASSMRKTMGDNAYYALADLKCRYNSELRQLACERNIKTWSGPAAKFRFIASDGIVVDIDLRKSSDPWKLIQFDGVNAPRVLKPSEVIEKTGKSPAREPNKARLKLSRITKETTETDSPVEVPHYAQSVSGLQAIKSPLIRLWIPPGQTPPPARSLPDGYRVVNSYIDPGHRFWLVFDNDLFSNTDRYYTNGVVLGYTSPSLSGRLLSGIMLSLRRNSIVSSSVSLHHGMYTPYTTKQEPTLSGDRPYASTLFVRYSQCSQSALKGIQIVSSVDAGVIGDAALGRYLQSAVHTGIPTNDKPLGWETQIKNDPVITYSVSAMKALTNRLPYELFATAKAQAGTLYNNASFGLSGSYGRHATTLKPLPESYSQLEAKAANWQYSIRGGFDFNVVAYDATLQGGMFNKHNLYALKPDEIERLVAALHLGLFVQYRKLGISLSQYYLSREFKQGRQHFWGQIGLQYGY